MKRTRNMIYNPSAESRELVLFIENDYNCYCDLMECTESLDKKRNKGVYDSDKAVDLMFYCATRCAERYDRLFSSNKSFSVTDRFTAAVEIVKQYEMA